jgi:tetratricopeptide (TPR) repeat protein
MLVVTALVLAQAVVDPPPPRRLAECAEITDRGWNLWERAKAPTLRAYCDLLASAISKLSGTAAMAQAALDAARQADRLLPGRAAPRALEGRALAELGDSAGALSALREATRRDPRVLEDAHTSLAWSRMLAYAGETDEALTAYRALLPRASTLPTSDRASAAIEAGLLAMAAGPRGLDDALFALREAMRLAQDEAAPVAVLALASALDRRGNFEEARVLLRERGPADPRSALVSPRAKQLLAIAPAERALLTALALEVGGAGGAREQWRAVVDEAPNGAWAQYARDHATGSGRPAATGRK